jgi:hypothetical protein
LTTATHHKLEHDAEQFLYLSQRIRDPLRFERLARGYRTVAEQISDEVITLSDAQIDVLGDDYNTPIHVRAAPEVAGHAVNKRADAAALAAQFEAEGAVSVDDLLTRQALDSLWRVLAGEHDLARLLPYRRLRRVLSRRRTRLPAGLADRR